MWKWLHFGSPLGTQEGTNLSRRHPNCERGILWGPNGSQMVTQTLQKPISVSILKIFHQFLMISRLLSGQKTCLHAKSQLIRTSFRSCMDEKRKFEIEQINKTFRASSFVNSKVGAPFPCVTQTTHTPVQSPITPHCHPAHAHPQVIKTDAGKQSSCWWKHYPRRGP